MPTGPAAESRGTPPGQRIALQPHPGLPWLLPPAGMAVQVLIDAVIVRVPNTRPWFLGVTNERGQLLPVFDLVGWSALPVTEGRRHIVVIGTGATALAVPCHVAPTLLAIDRELPSAPAEGVLAPFLGRCFHTPHGVAREFDVAGWSAAAALQIPGAAGG